MVRCYSELILLPTIDERFKYLRIAQFVAKDTFGSYRYLNQRFYSSKEWRSIRSAIVLRDNGCDLAMDGYPVGNRGYIHHINPITVEQLERGDNAIFNPENLILCSFQTHNAIHYSNGNSLQKDLIERHPGDTRLW